MNELQFSIEAYDECLRLRTILLAVGGAVMIVRIRLGPKLMEGEPAKSDHFGLHARKGGILLPRALRESRTSS